MENETKDKNCIQKECNSTCSRKFHFYECMNFFKTITSIEELLSQGWVLIDEEEGKFASSRTARLEKRIVYIIVNQSEWLGISTVSDKVRSCIVCKWQVLSALQRVMNKQCEMDTIQAFMA